MLLLLSNITIQCLNQAEVTPERFSIFDYPDPVWRNAIQQLKQQSKDLSSIQTRQNLAIRLNGQQYFVQLQPWQDQYGLDWLVLVLVPESDFTAQINANNRTTLLLCLGALAVSVLLGFYTSDWLARPILTLVSASQGIAQGNLEQQVEASTIQEISALSQSFNHMTARLKASFIALESANTALETRVEERTQALQQALQDLRQTQSQVVQTEKMSALGQLVAGVAHEINNPVGFIHGNLKHVQQYSQDLLHLVQLYAHHFPNPPAEIQAERNEIDIDFIETDLVQVLNSMNVGTERVRAIVLSLRNFSRLDESEFKAVDIHEGIDSTLLILQHRLKKTATRPGIAVVKSYGDLPHVECYPGQLNQVLMNLLANAIDALEERDLERRSTDIESNSSQIKIGTSIIESIIEPTISKWLSITIADNGPGISEAVRSKIFNPFFTTKPVGKGTGMGLAISYQIIVEKHGGKLDCRSTSAGTEFVIQIPLAQKRF